jgi:competence protein ComEC
MFFWNPFPFLRISLATAGGILLAYNFPDSLSHAHLFCLGFALLFALSLFWASKRASKFTQYLSGLFLILFFATFGYMLLEQHEESKKEDHLLNINGIEYWQGKVEGWLEERENTFRAEVQVEKVFCNGEWKKASGRVLTYFSKPTVDTLDIQYGTELLLANAPRIVDPPMNPEEFDYQRYLANQQIFHQHFVGTNPIEVLGQNPSNPVLHKAYQLRSFYRDKLSENIAGEQEQSIVLALLLGIKDGLDHDLKEAFSAAGAMHILAVSGLHVGIIFLVLSSMFSFLKTRGGKKGIFLFLLINLAALWLYALLAGASPSVLRASTMFSMILLTQSFSRKSNIYNSLALAAFVLLIYDPFLLFSVGFQLSFLAVFGIVFIQPKLSRLLVFDSWLMQKGWELTAVSIAAQLATFPLGLLYFHRFPNFFLISNLVVIPGAFAILFVGVFFFLIGCLLWQVY